MAHNGKPIKKRSKRSKRRKQSYAPLERRVPTSLVGVLGTVAASAPRLHRQVMEGMPFAPLERLQRALGISTPQIAALLQIPVRTLARRKTEGRLRPMESDRLLRTSVLYGKAIDLFGGDRDAARRWFLSPSVTLGGSSPFEYAKTEIGAREIEQVIGRLEQGVVL